MKTFLELIDEANKVIETVTVEDLNSLMGDPDLLVIDVQSKDIIEKNGMIPSAIHANRGFLEFYADQRPDNPFAKPEISANKKIVIYCGAGGQGALATKTLKEMGFTNVSNLKGGAEAWVSAGFLLEHS